MERLIVLNQKAIDYLVPKKLNVVKSLPLHSILVVITDNAAEDTLMVLPEMLVSTAPSHICCHGQYAELLHDYIDEELGMKEVLDGELEEEVAVTWHKTLEECFWFATKSIKGNGNIIIIDLSKSSKKRISKVLLAL